MATGNIYSKFCEVWLLTYKQTNPQTCKHMYIIQHTIEQTSKNNYSTKTPVKVNSITAAVESGVSTPSDTA